MIRPQQRRVKEHQAAIDAVKKGDDVITGGGIRGRVTKVSDDEAEVEIAQGVKVRVVKSTHQPGARRRTRSRRTTDARISRAGRSGWSRSSSRSASCLSIPSLIAGTAAGRQLAEVAPAIQDQPRPRPRRRQPPAARGRRARRAEAAAPGDGRFGRDRASPRSADRHRRHLDGRRAPVVPGPQPDPGRRRGRADAQADPAGRR